MSISTYIKKLILSLILFFFYFNSVSQQISIINENNLVSIFNKRLKSNDITIKEKDEYQKTILIWNENLNNSEKKIFISILNTLNYKNDYNFISFLEYFNLIISERLISKNKVEDLLYNYLNII